MAAASYEFGGILPFDCKGAITSVAPRWKKWKKSFEHYSKEQIFITQITGFYFAKYRFDFVLFHKVQ